MPKLKIRTIDWWIVGSMIALLFFSTITMASLGSNDGYLLKQSIWALVALGVLFVTSNVDMSFLKKHG